jgi:hypothetical protein
MLPPGCARLLAKPLPRWIGDQGENHRNRGRQVAERLDRRRAVDDNQVRFEIDDFLGQSPRFLEIPCGPPIVQVDILPLLPAALLQSLLQRFDAWLGFGVIFTDAHQHADPPHPAGLLRAGV